MSLDTYGLWSGMSKGEDQIARSSPSSSSAQSSRDTPFTHQTRIPTPDTFRLQENHSTGHSSAVQPPSFLIDNAKLNRRKHDFTKNLHQEAVYQDPFFVVSAPSKHRKSDKTKLSAFAEVFEPLADSFVGECQVSTSENDFFGKTIVNPSNSIESVEVRALGTGVDYVDKSIPIYAADPNSEQSLPSVCQTKLQRLQDMVDQTEALSAKAIMRAHDGAIGSPNRSSRYIMISNLPRSFCQSHMDRILSDPAVSQSRLSISDHCSSHGLLLMRYGDLRCAETAFVNISTKFPLWNCSYVDSSCWASLSLDDSYPLPSDFDGQVLVSLMPLTMSKHTTSPEFRLKNLVMRLSQFMMRAGSVRASSCVLTSASILAVKFEYYNIQAVEYAQMLAKDWPVKNTRLAVVSYAASATQMEPQSESVRTTMTRNIEVSSVDATSDAAKNRIASGAHVNHNPSRTIKISAHVAESAPLSHNVVDVQRIKEGQDVRTTIMLRNIPNKVDQPTLKAIVDKVSYGKYDFMYLRIDFANNCNVGYAFINFEDSHSIISFVEALGGKRWNCFNSDKTAEISYATIQGRDCLVQKFRNSSVMLEAPLFRPKIFCTAGVRAGEEEEFPPPDNQSKMRRSLENAEHVGLFAPRLGQRLRDEQRRRRSRFDRGSRHSDLPSINTAQTDGTATTVEYTWN